LIAQIAQSLQPIIDIEKPWLSPHAFAPNPSNLMESEMLPIDQVFRTVQIDGSINEAFSAGRRPWTTAIDLA
jgi:hypothetical protein